MVILEHNSSRENCRKYVKRIKGIKKLNLELEIQK